MKKTKTYEVSVINKTLSKTYSDQTKFYTSDTALELNFQLKEVEYDFDSAEIILLNIDDRSLATRPVVKSAEGFIYELEDDIVEHYGEWKGQLKFNEGGEIYVSSPVSFRIDNDLNNDRPPQLTEVNTWKNLRKIADGLIADIRSELESVAEQLSEIEGIESQRQQAEIQREFAESSRVSAEAQRKTDHANRSEELAGKADKVVLKNLIENGDFSDGDSGWGSELGTLEVNNGVATVVSTGTQISRRLIRPGVTLNKNDKYYFNVNFRYVSEEYTSLILQFFKNQASTSPSTTISNVKAGSIGWLFENTFETGQYRLTIAFMSAPISTNNRFETSNVTLLNLTKTFGPGNEPTKEEMDELIKVTGYIDGEYALNNKEMLIWTLALIRSNRNAIISLGGTV